MDAGKRAAAKAKFMELLPTRAEVGNTKFRANVRFFLKEEFSCTDNAASTHYNHAFQECKKTNPELLGPVSGGAAGEVPALGRPEGKNNGGRKKKVVDATTGTEGGDDAGTTAPVEEVKTYNVIKVKDKSLVLLGVSLEEAEQAVAKAAAGKKAKLEIQ